MIIKESGIQKTKANRFTLFGKKETGLTKAFAYILASNMDLLFCFLKEIGVNEIKSDSSFKQIQILIENKNLEGRTDIEIYAENKFHVIIEAKVGNNKVLSQRTQYLKSFNEVPQKVLCFISQINEFRISTNKNIKVKNLSWDKIDLLLDEKKFYSDEDIMDFKRYYRSCFKMNVQKEILVQDLSNENELKNYRDYNLYRRDVIFGSPMYFAPYFTRNSEQEEGEGISYMSKVLGIISCHTQDLKAYKEDLCEFANNDMTLVNKWLSAVKKYKDNDDHTFFFLADAVKLPHPLLKDSGREKGRGKNWIAAMIPKNRCVTFEDFVKHM